MAKVKEVILTFVVIHIIVIQVDLKKRWLRRLLLPKTINSWADFCDSQLLAYNGCLTAAFLLISAGDKKKNLQGDIDKKKNPLHGQYHMNKTFFLYHVLLWQWLWVKQQKRSRKRCVRTAKRFLCANWRFVA